MGVDRIRWTARAAVALLLALPGPANAQRSDVISQVAAMRAEHEMYSDWARRAVAWFEARTP